MLILVRPALAVKVPCELFPSLPTVPVRCFFPERQIALLCVCFCFYVLRGLSCSTARATLSCSLLECGPRGLGHLIVDVLVRIVLLGNVVRLFDVANKKRMTFFFTILFKFLMHYIGVSYLCFLNGPTEIPAFGQFEPCAGC